MTAYEKAEKLYAANVELDFSRDLSYYSKNGYVLITPEYLILGERVDTAWLVQLAVGEGALLKFVEFMPYYLPWIGWARYAKGRRTVKYFSTDRVISLIKLHEKRVRVSKEVQHH